MMTMPSTSDLRIDFSIVNTDPFLVFFGAFYLILGLSFFLANNHWRDFIQVFIDNKALPLVMGVLILPISLFVIVFYSNWTGLAPSILMILGYIGLAKSLILLLRPSWVQNYVRLEFVRKWLWLDGISGIVLGVALLVL